MHFDLATGEGFALPASLAWVVAIWLGVIGACIGSFLNVVIYRLPREISLVHPGSACPACGNAIRWYDNIPLLSWCWLWGRCRGCGQAISARYPAIEALVAAIFFLSAWAGPLGSGGSLPTPERAIGGLGGQLSWGSGTHQFLLWGYHVLLVCTLIAMAAIAEDRAHRRFPWRLWWSMLAVGLACGIVWPALRPVGMWPRSLPDSLLHGALTGAIDGLLGAIAGAVVAGAAYPILALGRWRPAVAASLLIGAYLGGQAALLIGAIATAGCLLSLIIRCCHPIWMCWLVGATCVWLVAWRGLYAEFTWLRSPTGHSQLVLLFASLCTTTVMASASRWWSKPQTK